MLLRIMKAAAHTGKPGPNVKLGFHIRHRAACALRHAGVFSLATRTCAVALYCLTNKCDIKHWANPAHYQATWPQNYVATKLHE